MKELIIYEENDVQKVFLVEDGILTEKYTESKSKKRLEGNIYIGKVQNVIPGLQAAFINVGENRNAFIHLKDVLPKKDISKEDNYDFDKHDISKIIKPGMPIIVEIKRDSYNKKGARASTHINLPGRYIVLLPNSSIVTVSHKIEDEAERNRLLKIIKQLLPDNMGAIARTSAVGVEIDKIEADLKRLLDKWQDIIKIEFSAHINRRMQIFTRNRGGIFLCIGQCQCVWKNNSKIRARRCGECGYPVRLQDEIKMVYATAVRFLAINRISIGRIRFPAR